MYSITLAYASSNRSAQQQNRENRAFYIPYLKKLIEIADPSIHTNLYGHGYTIMRAPGFVRVVDFGSKKTGDNVRVKETRINASVLNSGYANVPSLLKLLAAAKISPLQNRYEGEVRDGGKTYPPSYVLAGLTASVTEEEFENALLYINAKEKNPPSLTLLYSNCLAFAIETAKQAGFDLFRYAEKRNPLMPYGYLATFLSLAEGLNQVAENSWEGSKDGRRLEVTFRDRQLLAEVFNLRKEESQRGVFLKRATSPKRSPA
ncbi:MAG: hypothetical protein P4M13_07530 [Alphaproteobacteria bacterium]|nr:hypothetical protein [Alphaproteobacteria bacterium]